MMWSLHEIKFRLLLSNCLNWKIYCDDHSSISFTTAVQIWIISYKLHNMKVLCESFYQKLKWSNYKQLLDEVFVIFRIIKVEVSVIGFGWLLLPIPCLFRISQKPNYTNCFKENNKKHIISKKRINQPCSCVALRTIPHHPWTWHRSWNWIVRCARNLQIIHYSASRLVNYL